MTFLLKALSLSLSLALSLSFSLTSFPLSLLSLMFHSFFLLLVLFLFFSLSPSFCQFAYDYRPRTRALRRYFGGDASNPLIPNQFRHSIQPTPAFPPPPYPPNCNVVPSYLDGAVQEYWNQVYCCHSRPERNHWTLTPDGSACSSGLGDSCALWGNPGMQRC
jgi:hypothetical protein